MLAVFRKKPMSVFLMPGIITLVPGSEIFSSILLLIIGDYSNALIKLTDTVKIGTSISIAIISILIIPNSFFASVYSKTKHFFKY